MIQFTMNRQYAVCEAEIDAPTEESRQRFTRDAAYLLAREMLANGCVHVNQRYDLNTGKFLLCALVSTGQVSKT